MFNDDLTRTLVRERHRDLARLASTSTTNRLARQIRRLRRKRNPEQASVSQPTAH